ncbi:MAG TPA: electron transfer flavoprotein subunit beta/FixA family protein [Halanaerobiales bacterium]|nr:electron transfer flavoprotein subunit beta/FixA family protein [Halanaerobiales bacterium]
MNIVVCIKQVPDTNEVKIDKKTNTLIRKGVASIINPYDMHGIEAGLQLREKLGGKVTVISMGPAQAEDVLKQAISLGVDEAILLSDRAFAGADTLATSYTLAMAIEKIGITDLVICGKQAIDGDTAQVGPGIAEHLHFPHTSYVEEIVDINEESIRVKKKIEDGFELIEMQLPALITVIKELNQPRFPFLRGIFRSREIEIPIWSADDLDLDKAAIGLDGSPTQVVSIDTPRVDVEAEVFSGSPGEQVEELLRELSRQKIF